MNNQNNNSTHKKQIKPVQNKKIDQYGDEFEFSEELFDATGQVGASSIAGGYVTRNLVKEGEELLMMRNRQNNNPSK